jgi:hypothetical protein
VAVAAVGAGDVVTAEVGSVVLGAGELQATADSSNADRTREWLEFTTRILSVSWSRMSR